MVGSQIAIVKILADFNLAVAKADCQTAKFNSPQNFLAIHYVNPDKALECKRISV